MNFSLRIALFAGLVPFMSSAVSAECITRGVWHKETYCFGGAVDDYMPPDLYLPTQEEQVSGLVSGARLHLQQRNLMAARTQLDAALRLKPNDPAALSFQIELNRAFADEERRAAEQHLATKVDETLRQASDLEAVGRLDDALAKANEALRIAPASNQAFARANRLRVEVNAIRKATKDQAAARRRAEYEEALVRAQKETRQALTRLAGQLQSPNWQALVTAAAAANEAQSAIKDPSADGTRASTLLQIPFDRIEGLLAGPVLGRLNAGPKATAATPATTEEYARRLVDQIDYLDGAHRDLERALAAEVDQGKLRAIRDLSDIVEGIKATARVKLIDLSISVPRKP